MTDTFAPTFAEASTADDTGPTRRVRERRHRDLGAGSTSDRLAPFGPVILAVRWSATVATVIVGAEAFLVPDVSQIMWIAAMVLNAMARTLVPLTYDGSRTSLLNLSLEVLLVVTAVIATGGWNSPLVFCLISVVIIAGFASDFAFGARIALVVAATVSLPELVANDWGWSEVSLSARWATVLVLVGLVAGYSRRLSGEANRRQSLTLDRLNRLSDANALLFNLHRIAQTMPASLNYDEVLSSTIVRLRSLIEFNAAAVLVLDETDGSWVVARRQAMRIGQLLTEEELCPPARRAVQLERIQYWADDTSGPGFNPGSTCGIYAPLRARGSLIGLLCVESHHGSRFDQRDLSAVKSFADPVALAIDNARWFARLRTVGADEERTRIARDLHDRIGQSLAYLGFEVDRVIRHDEDGLAVGGELQQLRNDLRGVTTDVREALYDLRTDVGSEKDFVATLEEFSARVAERSELTIELDCDASARLPILQEREMWRIAQEALLNVERHAEASTVVVHWSCRSDRTTLEIADDGKGFTVGKSGRQDSYGILGMRERASSIGASLELSSTPGEGTRIRCTLVHR